MHYGVRAMSDLIQIIKNKRESILTGEIGALLHDIGKFHPDFIKSKSIEKTASDYHAQIDRFINPAFLSLIKNKKFEIIFGSENTDIYELITKHHEKDESKIDEVVKFLKRCDGKDSADDKGIVRKKQSIDNTSISSPFGYPKEKIDLQCLEKRFADLQDNLIGLFKNCISGGLSLTCFRESLLINLETTFSHALGETRIPSNDVTLWDHSRSTASLFKSVLCALTLGEKLDPNKLQWRILGFCWNGIGFINRGGKIADILKRSEIIEEIKGGGF